MRIVAIVGCGYTGLRLAQRLTHAAEAVLGFARSEQSLRCIAASGVRATALDLDLPQRPLDLDGYLVYYTVPPAPDGERDSRLERFLESLAGKPRRIVYMSTTGVYGDQNGARVDEQTPPAPKTPRAVRRLAAEDALRGWADLHAVSWCILRVPGIYGPGRLPLARLHRAEPAILAHEASPGNRIQVGDLVTVCLAAGISPGADRRIYNVTDGSEESLTGFLQRVARIAHLPSPPLITRAAAERSFPPSSWSFLGESRRVDNRRMLAELGVVLAYADLDAGIRASL